MVLLESSEGRKRAPWMLQLVFNKILTFPLDQFWVEKRGCGLSLSLSLLFPIILYSTYTQGHPTGNFEKKT